MTIYRKDMTGGLITRPIIAMRPDCQSNRPKCLTMFSAAFFRDLRCV
nr:MAG TPA: hypothetical protein [Caudoviricetes sp.]DAX80691.1 MAG TPA: hypothetical protein [Caudoviricetes sp.]